MSDTEIMSEVKKIIRWLSPSNALQSQDLFLHKRTAGTGEWFLKGRELDEWKQIPNSLLWLQGDVGSGKSVLVSTVINDLRGLDAYENQLVAFYFFDSRDASKQNFNNLVSTLLSQLLSTTMQEEIYLAIWKLYNIHENFKSKPSDRELIATLKDVISILKVNSLFVIIDGLDEMETQSFKPLFQLMEELSTVAYSHLHMLIASRPHIFYARELEQLCSKVVLIDKENVNTDVEIFLDYTMKNDNAFGQHSDEEKSQIVNSLTGRANGMFRWVDCQLIALQSCIGLKAVDSVLNQLPANLNDTYIQALQSIEASRIEDTKQVLQWLCFSMEPLTLDALGEVIAFVREDDGIGFEKKYRVDPERITFLGATLIHVDHNRNTVELAHTSVREFLLSEHLKSNLNTTASQFHMNEYLSHRLIAESSLAYLLLFNTEIADVVQWNEEYPISRYAAQHWYKHAKRGNSENVYQKAFKIIQAGGTTYINCLKLASFERKQKSWAMPQPLYYAAWCGLQDMVKQLVNGRNVNAKGGLYGSALSAAVHRAENTS
ncbi:hypothetical protein BT96DRAFT_40006 [Gymnopus androsaceus JB14]|uniref:NACHT domain-containing protein n=1 Tax=Gymnopus androsaceus JB14 TaxID=1447944 RepID=A0A6A4HJL1_9AGAR|nr:hypothetical protein BT96DRAFT_40006 [Gymnopus androsaceus JB14]